VHLIITIQKFTSNVQSIPASLQTFINTPNCVLEGRVQRSTAQITNVFRDDHLQIIIFVFCNRQVHRDFLITLYLRGKNGVCYETIYALFSVIKTKTLEEF